MVFAYSRTRQAVLVVGIAILLGFGMFVFYLGFASMQDFSGARQAVGSNRNMRRQLGRANAFLVLVMVGGLGIAFYAAKPGQMLFKTFNSRVELQEEGLVFVGLEQTKSCLWSEIKLVSEDGFTGLEIKIPNDYIVIPSHYDNWEDLVSQVKSRAPASPRGVPPGH